MEKIFKKIAISTIAIMLLLISCITHISYAQSAAEELKATLTEFKDQLGDLNQFKEVVDEVYDELNAATEVTPELKENLITSIRKLQNVEGINPLIADVLIQELEGQVNVLTNENLAEMKDEIKVIKEWVDEEVKNSENSDGDQNGGSEDDENQGEGNQTGGSQGNENQGDGNQSSGSQNGGSSTGNNQNGGNQAGSGQGTKDPTQSGNKLPHAGATSLIVAATVLVSAIAVVSIIKYKQLKDIK